MCVDEIQPYTPLTHPTGLSTVLAIGKSFIAFQMPFSACQAACPHSLGFIRTTCHSFSGCNRARDLICRHRGTALCEIASAGSGVLLLRYSPPLRRWLRYVVSSVLKGRISLIPHRRQIRHGGGRVQGRRPLLLLGLICWIKARRRRGRSGSSVITRHDDDAAILEISCLTALSTTDITGDKSRDIWVQWTSSDFLTNDNVMQKRREGVLNRDQLQITRQ